jgi:hypothetical protein
MPEEDYEFGSEGDYRADLRDDVSPRIQNGGTFKRSEFDRRPGQRIWKHTVNVGSGIDDWEDAACDG